MNKTTLIKEVERRVGLDHIFIEATINAVFDTLKYELEHKHKVSIQNFGIFIPKKNKNIRCNLNRFKDQILEGKNIVKFRMSATYKKKLNKKEN